MNTIGYPVPEDTFVPSPKASPELMISYPGWVIGVIPDYAAAADKLAAGAKFSDLTVFTVDGEHFQDKPDGLMVVKGPDASDRLRAAGARINEKYADSVIWVFGITYNSGGEALNMAATMPHNYVFTLDDLSGLDKIENRVIPKYRDRPWHPAAAGRNDLCPCGSGRKYKRCCMRK